MIRAALLLALLVGSLTGCSGDDDPGRGPVATASPVTAQATPPPRPADKLCYQLSYDAALAPTSDARPVSCAGPFTARTFHVGQIDTIVDGHLVAVDSDRVRRQVATACPKQFAAFVGGSVEDRRLSMLATAWFSPTVEAADRGESWFRCDAIALAAPRQLAPLTGRLRGVLGSEAGRARYGICSTAKPGTAGATRVICSSPHRWRAVATVPVRGTKAGAWPGPARAKAAGDACQDKVRDRAEDPLKFSWGYEWPSQEQWAAGQRYGLCWGLETELS